MEVIRVREEFKELMAALYNCNCYDNLEYQEIIEKVDEFSNIELSTYMKSISTLELFQHNVFYHCSDCKEYHNILIEFNNSYHDYYEEDFDKLIDFNGYVIPTGICQNCLNKALSLINKEPDLHV